ncbi:unnamed protein product, partial [Larinioides sclopetarius]
MRNKINLNRRKVKVFRPRRSPGRRRGRRYDGRRILPSGHLPPRSSIGRLLCRTCLRSPRCPQPRI